jgi:hypothetical protein
VLAAGTISCISAQAQTSAPQLDPVMAHQVMTAGCIYQFKSDPRRAQISADLRDNICVCMDNGFKSNNLNTEADVKANLPIMDKFVGYCVQTAVGQ